MDIEDSERQFITKIKEKIRSAQYEALKTVNVKLIQLYWEIGKSIAEKQSESWGKSIVTSLSKELQAEFPKSGGFSTTNIWYMVQFYTDYHSDTNLQPLVGEISWSKHLVILSKCKVSHERQFYILSTSKYNWSKNTLIHQIENKVFERYLLNQTNFDYALPQPANKQGLLAVKDNYTFDFLDLAELHSESELEQQLVKNIRKFLLEMGNNYTFVGNQYRIQVGERDYWVDILLYHRRLPIGVATYNTTNQLPKKYRQLLPSVEEITAKLRDFY